MVKKRKKKTEAFRNILQSIKKELDGVLDSHAKLLKRKEEIIKGLKAADLEEKKMRMKMAQLSKIKKSLGRNLLFANKKIQLIDKSVRKIHAAEKDLKGKK